MLQTTSTRNYSLDAARGILMMLGVLLHTANIYSVGGGWIVSDREHSQVFDTISSFIHVFRMPAFFWISGYFFALTYQRSGAGGVLRRRVPRLVIPLIVTWVTLNLTQEVVLAWRTDQSMIASILDGIPLFHLWFLVDLVVYVCSAAVVLPQLKRFHHLGSKLEEVSLLFMLLTLAFMSVVATLGARATGVAYDSILNLTSLLRLATNAPFFLVGIYMYAYPRARDTFLRVPTPLIVLALPLSVYTAGYIHGHGFLIGEGAIFLESLLVWTSVAIVLRIFHDVVKLDSPLTRFLSDAAYSVFLFHHILVVVIGASLTNYPINIWLKFTIVCTASFFASALVHVLVIRRSRVVRLLFNGK